MKMMNNRISFRIIAILCLSLIVICVSGLHAQETERRVSGTITDPSGESLVGVNVVIKGTTRGTITNIDGKYTIMAPKDATLEISCIGFERMNIAVENRSVINVVMGLMKDLNDDPKGIKPAKHIDLTWKQRDKANADNRFGLRMFREVARLEGDNTFFSPFSLNMAMGMLYNGTSGDTRTEMAEVLGITNFSEVECNGYYRTISRELLDVDPSTEFVIANAIWYRNQFRVKEGFVETGKNYFDAEVKALDFSAPGAAGIINDWCSDKTGGRINHIAANPLEGDMILTNAVYFKSKWQKEKKFDKENTKPDDFTKSDHTKIRVNMMEQTTDLSYYADPYLQCVELPYGNQAFNMIAILPPEDGNIDQLIGYLGEVEWEPIVKEMKRERVWLKIPRFRIECELPLNEPIRSIGMTHIFKGGLENISDEDLAVSGVLQKTFVEVNEEGTEAAAVTAMIMLTGAITEVPPRYPIQFFANRPFLFLIREKSTGLILFIGRIDDPRE
jgi:serpin B